MEKISHDILSHEWTLEELHLSNLNEEELKALLPVINKQVQKLIEDRIKKIKDGKKV